MREAMIEARFAEVRRAYRARTSHAAEFTHNFQRALETIYMPRIEIYKKRGGPAGKVDAWWQRPGHDPRLP